jgi:hypothetical protein
VGHVISFLRFSYNIKGTGALAARLMFNFALFARRNWWASNSRANNYRLDVEELSLDKRKARQVKELRHILPPTATVRKPYLIERKKEEANKKKENLFVFSHHRYHNIIWRVTDTCMMGSRVKLDAPEKRKNQIHFFFVSNRYRRHQQPSDCHLIGVCIERPMIISGASIKKTVDNKKLIFLSSSP